MKRVLITGTGERGFIGRNLKEALSERYHLFATTSKELDLTDYDSVARYVDKNNVDVIVFSGSSIENPLENDLKMYFSLERISREIEKIIYFGSGAEFDKRYDIIKARECDIGKRIPVDGYGFAKYVMTTHSRLSSNIYNLRLFGIFGKYEDWTYKFISNIVCKAIFDLPITIRQDCRFDYIYVDDIVDVIDWFITNEPLHHDYNMTSGKTVLLSQLAKTVKDVTGCKSEITLLNPDGFNKEYTADNERLRQLLPWFQVTPYVSAIEQLYKWYYDNKSIIRQDVLARTK